MKFNLYVIRNGKEERWTYDNDDNSFTDAEGKDPLSNYPVTDKFNSLPPFTPEHTSFDYVQNFDLLEIMLGAKCNFDCIYCSQRSFRDRVYSGKPSDVSHFISLLKREKIVPKEIQLWGGEPLVYWKTVQQLVPELLKLYPDIKISFPTNGSLLTRDKIDFIKKYNMRFWISHDGCHNEGRENDGHADILDDPVVVDAIQYAKKVLPDYAISFKTTYTHGNCNTEHIIRFFHNRFGSDTRVSLNNVVVCHDASNPISVASAELDDEDKQTLEQSLFDSLNNPDPNACDFSSKQTRDFLIEKFLVKADKSTIGCECGLPFGSALCVDMQGTIQKCHTFGPYPDRRNLDNWKNFKPTGYYNWKARATSCDDCLVVHSCQGGCPGTDNEAQKLSCPNSYALGYGIFRSAMAALFGVYLLRVEKATEAKD